MPPKKTTSPTTREIALFKKLYQQFFSMVDLEPWTLIDETVILGVKDPETGEVWYAYFMGEAGQITGFNIYPASEIGNWIKISEILHSDAGGDSGMDMLLQSFYQLAAETKDAIYPEVVALYKAAKITVGKDEEGYLDAISYRTGYAPTPVSVEDMQLLLTILPGLEAILNLVAANKMGAPGELAMLTSAGQVQVASQDKKGSWKAALQALPAAQPRNVFEVAKNMELIWESLRNLPRTEEAYMVYAGILPIPFTNEEGVRILMMMLMLFSAEDGKVLGMKQVPVNSWKDEAAPALAQLVRETGMLPAGIVAGESDYLPLVQNLGKALDIGIDVNPKMNTMGAEVFDDFLEIMMKGDGMEE